MNRRIVVSSCIEAWSRLPNSKLFVVFLLFVPMSSFGQTSVGDSPPEGVEQLLPRGQIAAVFEPEFVAAGDAEIPPGAWVLGVELEGEAKA